MGRLHIESGSGRRPSIKSGKSWILLAIWLVLVARTLYTNLKNVSTSEGQGFIERASTSLDTMPSPVIALFGPVLFAEAGKKKKKEKSEVVVISVQNSPAKGGMYPIFIPSCGAGHGYGRRKRRSANYIQ